MFFSSSVYLTSSYWLFHGNLRPDLLQALKRKPWTALGSQQRGLQISWVHGTLAHHGLMTYSKHAPEIETQHTVWLKKKNSTDGNVCLIQGWRSTPRTKTEIALYMYKGCTGGQRSATLTPVCIQRTKSSKLIKESRIFTAISKTQFIKEQKNKTKPSKNLDAIQNVPLTLKQCCAIIQLCHQVVDATSPKQEIPPGPMSNQDCWKSGKLSLL